MFTGIIEELGKVRQITTNKIQIACKKVLEDVKLGDSIAVNGVCLTVVDYNQDSFTADVSQETMSITALKETKIGDLINLERAMSAEGRFGGHIVTGHIDEIGKCISLQKKDDFYSLVIEIPFECAKYVVYKGSVTINGISLTVARINVNTVECAIIPHTFENTNIHKLTVGSFVNIEVDILAKYIEKFLLSGDNRSRIDYDFLKENGFAGV